MMRLGAIAAGIKQKGDGPVRRKRSPSEEEVANFLKESDHTKISDIDIRENTQTILRFRKLPWTEWLLAVAFLAGAIFIFGYIYFHDVKKLTNFGANIVMVILVGLAGLCIYEGRIEEVRFDRSNDSMMLKRTDSGCNSKWTVKKLSEIDQVYAARKGIIKANMDMTYYVLIVRTHNDQRFKILETKNAKKIRKELIVVRKFLGHKDAELAIFDETRRKEGKKKDDNFRGRPKISQMINSKGEKLIEDETIEIVAQHDPSDESGSEEESDDQADRKND